MRDPRPCLCHGRRGLAGEVPDRVEHLVGALKLGQVTGVLEQLEPGRGNRGRVGAPVLGVEHLVALKEDLTAVVSAEAFFSLTDLVGLCPDDAIASLVRTAAAVTRAATAVSPSRRAGAA
jgi:hypothetical protein